MSWAYGTLPDGREIGYAVMAVCEQPGCSTEIDRGLSFVCGGMHEGGNHGCGRYFCTKHLYMAFDDKSDEFIEGGGQLCEQCHKQLIDVR